MPRAETSEASSSCRFSSVVASPAGSARSIPSSPAASTAVAARYGLQEPSTVRSSIRPAAGMRSICVRLL
jgi:hypothetical protein